MSDITMIGLKSSGTLAKKTSNAQHSINCNGNVVVADCTFGQAGYNGLEIGLNKEFAPKNVTIENCTFDGTLTNNAILIFATQDDAEIVIKDCVFENVSNAVRLSNRTDAKNVKVTIENCVCKKWESRSGIYKLYRGFLFCEDYTNSDPASANLFAPEKISVTFKNCYGPNGKIMGDASEICGTQDENQVVYIANDNENNQAVVAYDSARYPTIICK